MDLALLTEKVRAIALEAGAFIREERKKFSRNAVEKNMRTIMCRMLTRSLRKGLQPV